MGAEIDRLEVQVEAEAKDANKQLTELSGKLDVVSRKLSKLNISGLSNVSKEISSLTSEIEALAGTKFPDFSGMTKQLQELKALGAVKISIKDGVSKKFGGVDSAKLSETAKNLEQVKNVMQSFSGIDMRGSGIITALNALTRFSNVDFSGFDTGKLGAMITEISRLSGLPDISSSVNRFMSSLQKLAGAGESIGVVTATLPSLGTALANVVNRLSGTEQVSDSVNMFVQSLGRLASAGNKTSQTASQMDTLADAVLRFFDKMKDAPKIRENTVRMTEALAKLASSGGKVGTATNGMSSAFKKLSSEGKSASSSIATAAKRIVSSLKSIGSAKSHLDKASVGFKNLLRSALPFVSLWKLFDLSKKAIDISSDLTEVQNVVDTTFGDMAYKLDDFSKDSIQKFGMSELAAKQYGSRFQAMGTAMGIGSSQIKKANEFLSKQTDGYVKMSDSLSDVSLNLTKLTADMASFYNLDQKDVAKNLQSIFTGETEPMRKYGIDLTQATLKEWALKQGLDANISSMSQAEKTMLRYQYVMANTAAAQGDFARTSDTWANQVRILQQTFEQLASIIGGTLINAFKPFVKTLNVVLQKVLVFAKTVSDALGAIFGWTIEVDGGGIADDDLSGSVNDAADGAGKLANNVGKADKNAEDLKKNLSELSFDELNKLSSASSSSGTNPGGSSTNPRTDTGTVGGAADTRLVQRDSLFEKYKSDIKSLEQLGKYIGDALSKAMEGIDWAKIYKKAGNFGKGLASFLNGLISPRLFSNLGKTIAGSLNTALHFLDSFGRTFRWDNFGESIAAGIQSFFDTYDFNLLKSTFETWGTGLATSLNGVFTEKTFSGVGTGLAKAVNAALSGASSFVGRADWPAWGSAIAAGINSYFDNLTWGSVGLTLNGAVNGILDTLIEAVNGTRWGRVGSNIAYEIKKFDFVNVLSKVGQLIWRGINAGIDTWKGLFGIEAIEEKFNKIPSDLDLTGLENGIKSLGAALAPFVQGFGQGFIEVIDFIVNDVTPAVVNAFAGALQFLSNVIDKIDPVVVKAVGESVGALAGAFIAYKSMEKVAGIIQGIGAALSGLVSGVSTSGIAAVATGTIALAAGMNKLIDSGFFASDEVQAAIGNCAKVIQSADDVKTSVRSALDEIEGKDRDIEATYETLRNLSDEYFSLAQKANKTAEEENELKSIREQISQQLPGFQEIISDTSLTYEEQKTKLNDLITSTESYYKTIAAEEFLKDYYKNLFDLQVELEKNKQAQDELLESHQSLYDKVRLTYGGFGTWSTILDGSQKKMNKLKDQEKELNQQTDELNQKYTAYSEILRENGVDVEDSTEKNKNAADSMRKVGDAADESGGKVGSINSLLSGLNGTSITAVAKFALLSVALQNLASNGQISDEKFSSLNASINNAKDSGEPFSSVMGEVSSTLNDAGVNANDFFYAISSGAKTMGNQLPSTFQLALQGMQELADGAKASATAAGTNVGAGLSKGIGGTFDDVKSATKKVVDDGVIGTAKDELDIHSPSRVADDIGSYFDQGLANGISNNVSLVMDVVTQLISGVKALFTAEYPTLYEYGGEYMTQISSGMNAGQNNVLSAVGDIANSITAKLSELSNQLYQYGHNAAVSFSNGISSVHIKMPHINVDASATANENGYSYRMSSSVNWYKKGGFPSGEIWGMNENGNPEMVGRVGNKTAVANNAIIAEAIKGAVIDGMMEVYMATKSGGNGSENEDRPIYVEVKTQNDEVLARAVARGQRKIDRRMKP